MYSCSSVSCSCESPRLFNVCRFGSILTSMTTPCFFGKRNNCFCLCRNYWIFRLSKLFCQVLESFYSNMSIQYNGNINSFAMSHKLQIEGQWFAWRETDELIVYPSEVVGGSLLCHRRPRTAARLAPMVGPPLIPCATPSYVALTILWFSINHLNVLYLSTICALLRQANYVLEEYMYISIQVYIISFELGQHIISFN